MGIELGLGEVEPDKIGSFDRVKPGDCHGEVVGIVESFGTTGCMVIDFEILAHTDPSQVGKIHREWYTKNQKTGNVNKMLNTAYAIGVTTVEAALEAKKLGRSPVLEFERDGLGKQCFFSLAEEEDNKKQMQTKFAFRGADLIFGIGNPKSSGYPRNTAKLAAIGAPVVDPYAAGSGKPPGAIPDDLV